MRGPALWLVVLVLAGCGGRAGAEDGEAAVGRAAERTAAAGSYRFETVYDLEGVPGGMRGDGAVDINRERGWLTYEFVDEAEGPAKLELRFLDGKTYMRFEEGGEAKWIEGAEDDAFGELVALGPLQTPHLALDALRDAAGEVEALGDDTVDGVETAHYRGRVSVGELFAPSGTKEEREAFEAEARAAGVTDVPVDAWVDGEGLLRKLSYAFDFTEEGKRGRAEVTLRFSRFGEPVDVQAPPSSEIEDFGGGSAKSGSATPGPCAATARPHSVESLIAALRAQGFDVSAEDASCSEDVTYLFRLGEDEEQLLMCAVASAGAADLQLGLGREGAAAVADNVTCEAPTAEGRQRLEAALGDLRER